MSQWKDGMSRTLSWVSWVAMGLLVAGCGTPERRPARYPVFSQLESIAVLPFQGESDDTFAREVERLLVSVQGQPGVTFRVFRRSPVVTDAGILALEGAIQDPLANGAYHPTPPVITGVYPPADAADGAARRLGKRIGVQAVMTGQVATTRDVSHYSEQEQTCLDYSKKKEKCKKFDYKIAYCTRLTVKMRAIPRVLDVASGRVLFSKSVEQESSRSVCSSTYPELSEAGLLEAARDNVLAELARDVAPYWVTPTLVGDLPYPLP